MVLETFLIVLALVVFGLAAMWLYAAIYDFVDYWKHKKKKPNEDPRIGQLKRMKAALVDGRLPPMTPASRYGMDHELPVGPPVGWEKRPSRPKAARMPD